MIPDEWKIGLTPEVSDSKDIQSALDWWHSLPIQNLMGPWGWANLCIIYYPTKHECYHLTADEVLFIYHQEKPYIIT